MNRKCSRYVLPFIAVGLLALSTSVEAMGPGKGTKNSTQAEPKAVELAALPKVKASVMLTHKGTKVPVRVYPGNEWLPSSDWFASKVQPKKGEPVKLRPTGEIVMLIGEDGMADPRVPMLHAMGVTVVVFSTTDLAAAFDIEELNPAAAFDIEESKPADGVDNSGGSSNSTTSPKETLGDVLHAMITWTTKHGSGDGNPTKIHIFGGGKWADLTLAIGATRSKDVESIIVDGASTGLIGKAGSGLAGKGFGGRILVLGARANASGPPEEEEPLPMISIQELSKAPGGAEIKGLVQKGVIELAPESMRIGKGGIQAAAKNGTYQKTVATFIHAELLAAPR